MLTAFEVLDAEEQERLERDLIDLIDRYNRRETMGLPLITWGVLGGRTVALSKRSRCQQDKANRKLIYDFGSNR